MSDNLDLFSSTDNKTILEAFLKAKEVLLTHNNIVVSVSGGGGTAT